MVHINFLLPPPGPCILSFWCVLPDHLKEEWQLMEERLILEEMLEVVEQRDSLMSLLEEQRLQESQED